MPAIRRVAHLGLVAAAMTAAPAAMAQALAQPGFATLAPQQTAAELLRHWRVLAERGNAEALFNLGNAYRLGRGVPQDLDAAEAFYARAARNNHVEAQGLYGLMLIQRGAQEDGLAEVERAARRGDARARYVLGTALFYGDGLTRDRPRALELMAQSAAGGFAPARELLADMQQEMAAASPPPPAPPSPDGMVALAEAAPTPVPTSSAAESMPPPPVEAATPPPVPPPPPVQVATPAVAVTSELASAPTPPPPVAAASLPAPAPAEISSPPATIPAAGTRQAEFAIEPAPTAEAPPVATPTSAPAEVPSAPALASAETAPPAAQSAPTPAEIDTALASPPPVEPVEVASAEAPLPPADPPPAVVEAAPIEAPSPALVAVAAEPSRTIATAAPPEDPTGSTQPTPAAGGWRLQLGAFRVEGNARRAWQELGPLLPNLQPHFARQGELTLLQAGPLPDRAAARRACAVVRGAGLPCLPWGPPSSPP